MYRSIRTLVLFCAISSFAPLTVWAVTIPTVPVGNAGNANDTTGFGAVASDYRIGTTEVSNAQYVAFLNAKAASDPLALYSTSMGSGFGGITRTGSSPSFSYNVIAGRGDMPVNFVSWYDSIRFANWLHNGQGSGDTETGAYTLLGGTATPTNGLSITRNAGATWFLASEDEWYKAAYHKNDGVTGNYFDYPTANDTAPTAEAPAGGSNSANYNIAVGDLTDVGAYTSSDSPYGTFDQAGNLWEWNEALIGGVSRGFRGGSRDSSSANLLSSGGSSVDPASGTNALGFRVATIPEPSTAILAAIGLVGLAAFGWRRVKLSTLMTRTIGTLVLSCAISSFAPLTVWAVTIPTVPVGNAGNAGEVQSQGTFGAVADDYRIGTHEVTNAQYVAFLSAKAESDPLGLYSTSMGSGFGGITRTGSSPNFAYGVIAGRGDMPVNFVSWFDSIRFSNWLHNGQGSGDTETGAYTLGPLGAGGVPINGLSITRNAGATWFLTSEDEWYKAAYHKNDGTTGNYFDYPTSSDTAPTAEAPPGGSNSANYTGVVGDLTDVGAYTGSDSPYGTFDQGGNLWEWNEALIGSNRLLRGGSFSDISASLRASVRGITRGPLFEGPNIGFRVATVPEPSTVILAAIGLVGLAAFGWRRVHIIKGGERS